MGSKARPKKQVAAPPPPPPPPGTKKRTKNAAAAPPSAPSEAQSSSGRLLAHYSSEERRFLEGVSYTLPEFGLCSREECEAAAAFASQALVDHQCCVLHNALSAADVDVCLAEYGANERVSAIGERESAKRSGTRLFNCACQLGPSCAFEGWRSAAAREILCDSRADARRRKPWRDVVRRLGFDHVARVEVVTSHVGCRHQGWHVDGARGVTALFALVDVDPRLGPTQLDFTTPFMDVASGAKVKGGLAHAPRTVFAGAIPKGSLLLFNANVTHRGTANLGASDRPVLVLDCSPPCGQSRGGFYGDS